MNQIISSYQFFRLLLVLCLCSQALSLNLKPGESCASICSGKQRIFKYEENKIYVYNFLSTQMVKNPNGDKEVLSLELSGKAELSMVSACDFSLSLTGVNFKQSLSAKESKEEKSYQMMKTMLEKYNLRFGFDDGRIVGVCPNNKDHEFAVNIKKGILSSLQVSLDSLDAPNYLTETDISGDCITEYSTKPEPPNFVVVKKTKSISGCARKNKYFSTVTGRVFEQPMENRNFALLDGSHECNIKIKRSEGLKESICKEVQSFRPFSSRKTGSSVEIKQELKFNSVKSGKIASEVPTTRLDLVMNHGDKKPLFMKIKLPQAMEIAKQLCTAMRSSTDSSKRTKLFVQLIQSLTLENYNSIQTTYKYFNENSACSKNREKIKNLFLDALPHVKTNDAFKFLIEDAKIYEFHKLGLNFIENSSPSIIALFASKLENAKVGYSALLTLSGMIKTFCQKTPGCMLNPDIIQVMNKLVTYLGSNCNELPIKHSSKILFTLRALGNAGDFPDYNKLVNILQSCITSTSNSAHVKAYALEVVRQFPCHADIDTFLWTIYDDISHSSEVRIQAYLSLVRCPLRETFRKVVQKLNNEKSQQLGSFVWSHISNLMETSDRFKTELRDMLQVFSKPIKEMSRRFNLDFRSYSKNIEKTFQRGLSSAKVDANIIFSSSPFPSSFSTNVTLDVFGRSVNIFEFGYRGNLLESNLNRMFKPTQHKNPHPSVVKMDKKHTKRSSSMHAMLYTKIMGREVFFTPNILDEFYKSAMQISENQSWQQSLLLLDATVSFSSITGFPVEIEIQSALSGEWELNKNKNFYALNDMELALKNHIAVQIIGKLQVNAHCTKIGVKSTGTASTDAEFGGKLKFVNGVKKENFRVLTDYVFEINKMPDNSKLIAFSNELKLIHDLSRVEAKPEYKTLIDKCTGNHLLELRGIQLCSLMASASKYDTYFSNVKAELNVKKFNGFKFRLTKEYFKKMHMFKWTKFLLSTSFQGGESDTFKFQFDQDPSKAFQSFELGLWNKDVHVKLVIDKLKISGKLKYGSNEASLAGSMNFRGITSSTVNLKIKSKNDVTNLKFQQKFTHGGNEITLNAESENDKSFNIDSKTTVKLSKHQDFNFYQRLRHETKVKFADENTVYLKFQSSQGNKPTMELKAELDTYWSTKSVKTFAIKQNYVWSKLSVKDYRLEGERVAGVNYTIFVEQKIEMKDKKFHLKHDLNYFVSKERLNLSPYLVALKLKTFDVLKNEVRRQINWIIFLNLGTPNKGTVLWKHFTDLPVLNYRRDLNAMAVWKKNAQGMYDLDGEIREGQRIKMVLRHKFTSTQTGISVLEFKTSELYYTIQSEMNLPKSHVLTITGQDKTLVIRSKVNAKSITPFKSVIQHDIEYNKKLVATIENTVEYDKEKGRFSFNSLGKKNEKKIFSLAAAGQLKHYFGSTKINYDFGTTFDIIYPSKNIDIRISNRQFANIILDGKFTGNGKNFESAILYENNNNQKVYGYEMVSETKQEEDKFCDIETKIYTGQSIKKVSVKVGKAEKKYLIGFYVDSDDDFKLDALYKIHRETGKISTSSKVIMVHKTNKAMNFYYKNNVQILYESQKLVSASWNGKLGKNKEDKDLRPFSGSVKIMGTKDQSLELVVDIPHPILLNILNAHFGLHIQLDKLSKMEFKATGNILVKWQKLDKIARYYELKTDYIWGHKADGMKESKLGIALTQDSSENKLLVISGGYKFKNNFFESTLEYVRPNKNGIITLFYDRSNYPKSKYLFSIQTSLGALKTLTLSTNIDKRGSITVINNFKLVSDKLYNIEIKQVKKINVAMGMDFVNDVTWDSNVPYLNSGSYSFGVLIARSENYQLKCNLEYKGVKKLNVKLSANIKSNEIQAYAESFFVNPLKFSLHAAMVSANSFTLETECGYKDDFFKITNGKITWKRDHKLYSDDFTLTFLSSNKDFTDIKLAGTSESDPANYWTTFKVTRLIEYKGKAIHKVIINLKDKEIFFDSSMGSYIKDSKIRRVIFDLKYDYRALTDMGFKYSATIEPIFEKSQLEFVYFRKEKEGKSKSIETLGKAVFYKKLNFENKNYFFKELIFINEDVTNGIFDLDFNLPNIKPRKLSLKWDISKKSATEFKGVATYQDNKFEFLYESEGPMIKSLEVNLVSGKDWPRRIAMSYYIQKELITVRFNIEKIVHLNIELKPNSENKHSGFVNLAINDKKVYDLKVNTDTKLPKDTKTVLDILKALLGIRKGLYLKYELKGDGPEGYIERIVELYHLESTQFPGGQKSFYNGETKLKTKNSQIAYKFSISVDYYQSMFDISQEVYFKVDGKAKYDSTGHVKFISSSDFLINTRLDVPNDYESTVILIYNKDVIQTRFYINLPSKPFVVGFGFRNLRKTNELSLNFVSNINKVNYTIETNLGNLFCTLPKQQYFPVGKEYFIDVFNKYVIKVARKQDKEYDLYINYGKEEPIKLNLLLIDDTAKNSYGFRIKGSSPWEKLKQYSWKFNLAKLSKDTEYKIASSISINKKLLSDLTLRIETSPLVTIKIDYKGSYKINGVVTVDKAKKAYSHIVTVRDGTYKTELWSSKSKCDLKPNINCFLIHINKVRKIILGLEWEKDYKKLELTWNKYKKQGLILLRKTSEKSRSLLFENPFREIIWTYTYPTMDKKTYGIINLVVRNTDKTSNTEDTTFQLKYKMKGSFKSDYKLELNFRTSLMKKKVALTIKRDVSLDIGDLYVLDVKAMFDDEKSPFFGVKGFLRQLSSRSYKMELHFTNYDKFAILTTTAIFISEELTLEYKLEQSNLPTKEFLIQYIPFKKFHITNNKDFKILMSRKFYQYGYRGDYVIKLGSEGTNIVAYSTYSRSPWKYYAELASGDQKTVIHIRPIGNNLIGELYRKTSDQKILDASLKINVDEKSVLNSKIHWDPKLFDRTKKLLLSILKPENLQNLLSRAYQNSENQFSTFISNLKSDLIKNLKISESLEFAKGIANDLDKFPRNIVTSYDDDDYYMKTMMTSISSGLSKFEISSKVYGLQQSTYEVKEALSRSIYNFVVNAKFYSFIYKPLEDALNNLSYDDVKQMINGFVNTGKKAFNLLENIVNKIAISLEKIAERAKASVKVYKTFKEKLEQLYKSSMLKKLFDIIADINDSILNKLESIFKTKIIKQRLQYYQEVIANSELLVNFYRNCKERLLEYFKSSNIVAFVSKTLELIRTLKYKEAFLNFFKLEEAKFDMDLDKATMDFQFYVMPLTKTYLRVTKSFSNLLPIKTVLRSRKTNLGERLLDLFYRYEYLMFNYGKLGLETVKKLFPPFDRSAWVLNGKMIVTFDGNAVKIGPGECTYVLARDFKEKSFTLYMTIKSENNKKEFKLEYFKTVTILQDGSIKVNGQTVSVLPKLFEEGGKTLIIYRDDELTKIQTSEGLLIKYFHQLDSLKVKVNGQWHGSVGGLLGSNDFDLINDLATPSGLITHDAGVLSKSWSFGVCDGKTKTGLYAIRVDPKYLQQCVNLFHPDSMSYLKRCYSLINPEPYFELCHRSLQYSVKDDNSFKKLLCDLSRNYVMRCKVKGILLRLDKTCVKCGDKKLNALVSENVLDLQKKFNIILIMEQSKCLAPYKELIKSLVGTLGYKSQNLFTLLTYNGKGFFNDVYFRSVNQKINNNKNDFMKLIENFWSDEQISEFYIQRRVNHPGKAIFDAIKMSSTPGYVEKIILIGCTPCAEHDKYVYSLLAGLLDNAGITLTYLTTQQITGTEGGSGIVGLGDRRVFYFDKKILKSSPWNRRVQAPKDACSPLARLKQGFVWSLAPLLQDNKEMKMRRVAERIQSEIQSEKSIIKQKCYCNAGNYDQGSVECKVPKSGRSSLMF